MALWQIFSFIGVGAIILEILIPSGFFLNFALAGFITAVISLFVNSIPALVVDFVILSFLSLILIRPLLLKSRRSDKDAEALDNMYIGKIVKVVEPVTKNSGTVSIFDERWDARLLNDEEEIPAGSEAKVVKSESLVLFVERV